MLIIASVLFAIAALLGITIATMHCKQKPVALPLALIHGLFAASGLVILILALSMETHPTLALVSLGLFVLAALGGFVLFILHLKEKPMPCPLIGIHGVVAVAGFLVLLKVILSS